MFVFNAFRLTLKDFLFRMQIVKSIIIKLELLTKQNIIAYEKVYCILQVISRRDIVCSSDTFIDLRFCRVLVEVDRFCRWYMLCNGYGFGGWYSLWFILFASAS